MKVFRARRLATMLGAVIDDGCVVVDGDRITDVGPTHLLRPLRVDVEIDGVLMPGLINAHTHLELTNVPRPPRPGSFVDWVIETMASQRRDTPEAYARDRAHAVRQGVEQCLKFGVTCVGDISQNVVISRPILAGGPIRSVSFGECLGIGERAARFARLLESATTEMAFDESPWMRTGVSPHAPYTVDRGGYIDAYVASPRHDPLTTHFAETPHEAAFAGARAGPLAELYARLGFDPGEPTFPAHADVLFAFLGTFDRSRWLLAHVNYCTSSQLDCLAGQRPPGVVWCPRTHRYFGHPPHPWKEMIARDINVCVGTDSCASSGDLNVVDDLRLLHADEPGVAVERLWAMVTRDADRALRWGWGEDDGPETGTRPLGVIAPGAMADFVAFAATGEDPLREILETPALLPSGVWVGGESFDRPNGP